MIGAIRLRADIKIIESTKPASVAKTTALRPGSQQTLVGIDVEAQRFRAGEHDEIILAFPVGRCAQGCDQIVIDRRPLRRAGPLLHRTGYEDHGIARDRKLTGAAFAPEIELGFAIVADL